MNSSENLSPVRSSRGFAGVLGSQPQPQEESSPLAFHSSSRDHETSKISVDNKRINFRLRQDSVGDLTDADSPLTIDLGKKLPPLVRGSQSKVRLLPFQIALEGSTGAKKSFLASSRHRVKLQEERLDPAVREVGQNSNRLLEYLRSSQKTQRSQSTFRQSLEHRDSTRAAVSHRISHQSSERLNRLPGLSCSCLVSAGRLCQPQAHPEEGEGLLQAYEKRIESMRRELANMRTEL